METTEKKNTTVKCWDCRYCDKESIYYNNVWRRTRTGFCTAEGSVVNGGSWYAQVTASTIYPRCSQYLPLPVLNPA